MSFCTICVWAQAELDHFPPAASYMKIIFTEIHLSVSAKTCKVKRWLSDEDLKLTCKLTSKVLRTCWQTSLSSFKPLRRGSVAGTPPETHNRFLWRHIAVMVVTWQNFKTFLVALWTIKVLFSTEFAPRCFFFCWRAAAASMNLDLHVRFMNACVNQIQWFLVVIVILSSYFYFTAHSASCLQSRLADARLWRESSYVIKLSPIVDSLSKYGLISI